MKKSPKFCRKVAALLTAAALCVVIDNKYNLRVTEYRLSYEKLPESFDGFKFVQLSDLHGMEFGRDNERLVELVRLQQPDIIALTGDMAENLAEMQTLRALLKGLQGIAPMYFVTGNHEYAGKVADEVRELMAEYGARCMDNRYEQLFRNGDDIIIAGADDPNGRADMIKPEELAAQLRGEYPEDFVLWLGHRNHWVEKYPELPVELILSGHAHGGIVRLPFIGGVFSTAHSVGATYEKGLYYGRDYVMAVSRGLGNSVPVPRFLNGAELVSIVLEKK